MMMPLQLPSPPTKVSAAKTIMVHPSVFDIHAARLSLRNAALAKLSS